MKPLLAVAVLVVTLGVLHSAPEETPKGISEDTMTREMAQRKSSLHAHMANDKTVPSSDVHDSSIRQIILPTLHSSSKHVEMIYHSVIESAICAWLCTC